MEALIVLHGLFLVTCNQSSQTCQIMIADTPPHLYRAGFGIDLATIPQSKNLTITLPPSTGENPMPAGFPQKQFALDSSQLSAVPSAARSIIQVPMPEEIIGANRSRISLNTLLNGLPPADSKSQADASGNVLISETSIFHYLNVSAESFSLMDGATQVKASTALDNRQIMVLYSWPPDCNSHGNHTGPFNRMLQLSTGGPPNLVLGGILNYASAGDESGMTVLNLPAFVLRPPCVEMMAPPKVSAVRDRKSVGRKTGASQPRTVDPTGCPQVYLFP